MAGRRPDYDVVVSQRPEEGGAKRQYANVGAAWKLDSGAISIRLRPGIAIVGAAGIDVALYPPRAEEQQRGEPAREAKPAAAAARKPAAEDDIDIW